MSLSLWMGLLLSLLLVACGQEDTSAPPPEGSVTVATLKAEALTLTRELPGRTSAFLVADVRPQVNGVIEERLFVEGEMIEEGQPLYQIDDSLHEADLGRAEAALERAQATLVSTEFAAQRARELVKTNAVSQQHYEDAIAALGQATADVKAAEAQVNHARIMLDYTRITSPVAGRIGKSHVTPGALVTANQSDALATVQQLDPLYVDLTQSSREWLELRRDLNSGTLDAVDLPVTIVLEDGSHHDHPGTLNFADVSVNPGTGSLLLRVLVPNPDTILLPGMYVRAVVALGERPDALLVPQQGITRDPSGDATALVVNGEEKVERRTVRVSRSIGDKWLVEDGLAAGDRVIIEGLQKVQPGMKVNATERSRN